MSGWLGGATVVDRRIPVRALTWAWNRLEWPPIERLAGPADVVHSQSPLLIPTAGAASVVTIHDLHFLSRPDHGEAEIRRDFPALVRDHARRADHVIVSSRFAAADVSAAAGCRRRSSDRVLAWRSRVGGRCGSVSRSHGRRQRSRRSAHPLPRHPGAAKEHRRSARTPTARSARGGPTRRRWCSPAASASRSGRYWRSAERSPLAGARDSLGLRQRRRETAPLSRGRACWSCRPSRKASACRSSRRWRAAFRWWCRIAGRLPEVAGDAATPVDPDDAEALGARDGEAARRRRRALTPPHEDSRGQPHSRGPSAPGRRVPPTPPLSPRASSGDEDCCRRTRADGPADRRRPLPVGAHRAMGGFSGRTAARVAVLCPDRAGRARGLRARRPPRWRRRRRHPLGAVEPAARARRAIAPTSSSRRVTPRPSPRRARSSSPFTTCRSRRIRSGSRSAKGRAAGR